MKSRSDLERSAILKDDRESLAHGSGAVGCCVLYEQVEERRRKQKYGGVLRHALDPSAFLGILGMIPNIFIFYYYLLKYSLCNYECSYSPILYLLYKFVYKAQAYK